MYIRSLPVIISANLSTMHYESYTHVARLCGIEVEATMPQSYIEATFRLIDEIDVTVGMRKKQDAEPPNSRRCVYNLTGPAANLVNEQAALHLVTIDLIANAALAHHLLASEQLRRAALRWVWTIGAPIPIQLAASSASSRLWPTA